MHEGALPLWLLPPLLLLLTLAVGLGVVVGFHRLLTHRALVVVRPLEVALVVLGLPAGTPVGWVGHHRHHHAHTDEAADLHSPRHHGFWVAHCGWYLATTSTTLSLLYALAGPLRTLFDAVWRSRSNQDFAHLAKDVAADPLWGPLSRPGGYALVLLGWVALLWLAVFWAFGAVGLVALWGFHVTAYNFGDFVNSWGHTWGSRSWTSDVDGGGDDSRDHALLALLTLGDGWHAGHHAFPSSVKSGLLPDQFDLAFEFCRLCERLRLASQLRVPTTDDLERRRRQLHPITRPPARQRIPLRRGGSGTIGQEEEGGPTAL